MQQINTKYEFYNKVGQGSYGVVYKCRDKTTGEFVAIKRFKLAEDELLKKMISRELRINQIVKLENIVEYKECFKRKGELFVVFEYIEENMIQLLERVNFLDEENVKKIIYQLCRTIYYLNSIGIVHRDIKPENLLITFDEKFGYKLKLCDFGFAKRFHYLKLIKEIMTDYVATRWYRAPELILAEGEYGYEIDYWAIGCIMAELIDGNPLLPGNNDLDQLLTIQKVLGKFTEDYFKLFENLSPFINIESLLLGNISEQESLTKRFEGKISDLGLTFMLNLLEVNPKRRLKGIDVLLHPYFDSLSKDDVLVKSAFENKLKTEKIIKNHILDFNKNNSFTAISSPFKIYKTSIFSAKAFKEDKKTNSENDNTIFSKTTSFFKPSNPNNFYNSIKKSRNSIITNNSIDTVKINKTDFRKIKKFFTSTLFKKENNCNIEKITDNNINSQINFYYTKKLENKEFSKLPEIKIKKNIK